ncbi:MAG: hypothetical protein ACOC44_01985 [Promethearchaeia archaeon]
MSEKKREETSHRSMEKNKKAIRIEKDPDAPRLGRRESEPHSMEVTYIHDILTTNFPESRVIKDIHYYFRGRKGSLKGKKIDIIFDITFLHNFSIPYTLEVYDASKHGGRIPEMAINILSERTWKNDLTIRLDECKSIGIPVYVVFSPYKIAEDLYGPPFLRVYTRNDDGSYRHEELHACTMHEGKALDLHHIIDITDKLPFRLGLMQLKQQLVGGFPLFRLIFIDPAKPRLLPSSLEKLNRTIREKREEIEKCENEM